MHPVASIGISFLPFHQFYPKYPLHSKIIRSVKDVRVHCYRAFLLRTLFIRHARATSCIKRAHRAKHLTKCSADGRCVNLVRKYFCWMHGDPHLFFDRSLPFLIISIKNKKFCAWEVVIISRLLFRCALGAQVPWALNRSITV